MSRGARWTLGLFAILFGATFVASEQIAPAKVPGALYVLAAFCGAIAVACFSPRLRDPAVRLIGITVFLTTVWYFVDEITTSPGKTYCGTSSPHWINAIFAGITFGLPGLYVAMRGKYPSWGKGAEAFSREESSDDDLPDEQDSFSR